MSRSRRPSPPPLEANDLRVTIVGTVAWAAALVVALVLRDQIPAGSRWWIWTCVAGVGMGLFAVGAWFFSSTVGHVQSRIDAWRHPFDPHLYDQVGGMDTFQRLVDAFYQGVETDPILRPMYPDDLTESREHLALFLAQYFGGPGISTSRPLRPDPCVS